MKNLKKENWNRLDWARFSQELEAYLSQLFGDSVKISKVRPLGAGEKETIREGLKGFGYGVPYFIEFVVNGKTHRVILETMRREGFGHDHFSDRAGILLWQHSCFNILPKHVKSLDVGCFTVDGKLKSVGNCEEFFILTEYVSGQLYYYDLDRIRDTGEYTSLDYERCLALSNYLVEIHSKKRDAPWLYVRRIRDLIGHGECIMGIIDNYPRDLSYVTETDFVEIEKKCVEWRWRLKKKVHRLSQVHGDYHPWNIMFHRGTSFTLLDRSRGEWGEPADDLTALTVNYIFYSLQKHGKLAGVFQKLFNSFWGNYLNKTHDEEILEVVQPFYAWRALVIASPVWYPHIPLEVRRKLFNFIKNVLQTEKFELEKVNSYLEA